MKSFDIVSLDLFSTLVYLDRKIFNPYNALKIAFLQSNEFKRQLSLIDEIIKLYYEKVRNEMHDYEKEAEFNNEAILLEVCKEKKILNISNLKEITAKIIASYFDSAMPIIHPYPDLHETLGFLKEKGYTLVLTSNHSYPPNGWAVLKKYDLDQYFHRIVFSGEIGWKKPSKKIFKQAFKGLEYSSKTRIIHIGDDPKRDIRGALEFGIKALLILPPHKQAELKKLDGIHGIIPEIRNVSMFL
jgi:putative hydrolase of the HAD superfamily